MYSELPRHIGDSQTFIAHDSLFTIKKIRHGLWALARAGSYRIRFGTAEQIREDMDHAALTGELPRSKGGWA